MYTLVRRFIKTGIVFLFVGLALGGWLLVEWQGLHRVPNPYLVSAHVHAVLVGFVLFLILGVALWLFPRPEKGDVRYRPELIAAAYWILLVATGVRFAADVGRGLGGGSWLGWPVVAGGLGQIVGLALYFWTMWSRIRPVGSHLREARGERF